MDNKNIKFEDIKPKKVSTLDGSEFVQTTRGRPYGYLAAVLGADGKTIYSGFTYVSENTLLILQKITSLSSKRE